MRRRHSGGRVSEGEDRVREDERTRPMEVFRRARTGIVTVTSL